MDFGLSSDSPLRSLPVGLPAKQLMFFESVRLSIEMCFLCYNRLYQGLSEISFDEGQRTSLNVVSSYLDAWSIVDSLHRLRELLNGFPGHQKSKSTAFQVLIRKTNIVRELRNSIQHIRSKIEELSETSGVWGSLSWVIFPYESSTRGRICGILPGGMPRSRQRVVNPIGKRFESNLDQITLSYLDYELSLSESIRELARFTTALEAKLDRIFKGQERQLSDLFLSIEFECNGIEY